MLIASCSASTVTGLARHARHEIGAVSVMLMLPRAEQLSTSTRCRRLPLFPAVRIGGLREDLPRGFHAQSRVGRFPASWTTTRISHEERGSTSTDPRRRVFRRRRARIRFGRSLGGGRRLRRPQVFHPATNPTYRADATDSDVYRGISSASRRCAELKIAARRSIDAPTGPFAVDDPITPPPKDRVYAKWSADPALLIYSQASRCRRARRIRRRSHGRAEGSMSCRTARTGRGASSAGAVALACQALERMIVGAHRRRHRGDWLH